MKLRLTAGYVLAFLLLNLVVSESHELAHILTGGAVCGCFGERSFNVWETCATCAHPHLAFLASAAGPVWSYCLMWLGAALLRSAAPTRQALGFSLLFAALPFARIFTTATGAGDEIVLLRMLLQTPTPSLLAQLPVLALVLLLAGTPILLAYRRIRNRHAGLWVAGFCVAPLLFQLLYIFKLLNGLLAQGILAAPWLFQMPLLITLHTVLVATLLILLRKQLLTLTTERRPLHPVALPAAISA